MAGLAATITMHIVYRKSADHANEDALARLLIGSDPNFDKEESIVEIDSEFNMLDIMSFSIYSSLRKPSLITPYKGFDSGKGAIHCVTNGWSSTWAHNQDKKKFVLT